MNEHDIVLVKHLNVRGVIVAPFNEAGVCLVEVFDPPDVIDVTIDDLELIKSY